MWIKSLARQRCEFARSCGVIDDINVAIDSRMNAKAYCLQEWFWWNGPGNEVSWYMMAVCVWGFKWCIDYVWSNAMEKFGFEVLNDYWVCESKGFELFLQGVHYQFWLKADRCAKAWKMASTSSLLDEAVES